MATKLEIKMMTRNPQTKRLKEAKIDATLNDISFNQLKELWSIESWFNENTPIRMHIHVVEVPEDMTITDDMVDE